MVTGEARKLLRMIRENKVMDKSGVRVCNAIWTAFTVTRRKQPDLVEHS